MTEFIGVHRRFPTRTAQCLHHDFIVDFVMPSSHPSRPGRLTGPGRPGPARSTNQPFCSSSPSQPWSGSLSLSFVSICLSPFGRIVQRTESSQHPAFRPGSRLPGRAGSNGPGRMQHGHKARRDRPAHHRHLRSAHVRVTSESRPSHEPLLRRSAPRTHRVRARRGRRAGGRAPEKHAARQACMRPKSRAY